MLKVKDLCVDVGNAVQGVSFEINPGETMGLVGESGSGKTKLAQALMRFSPSRGLIEFEGVNLLALNEKQMREYRKKSRMIFQDPQASLNPTMKIGAQIIENSPFGKEKAIQMLTQVGIDNSAYLVNRYPHELSGGMRQRVMIAIAMISNPSFLIADEPTTSLDVKTELEILALLKGLKTTLLFISHDLHLISKISDRVMVMYKGKIVEIAKTKTLFEHPVHPYTQSLLRASSRAVNKAPLLNLLTPLIEVKDLKVHFTLPRQIIKAVDGVSLVLKQGQTLAVIGESGSGKTTLARTLLGLYKPTSGTVISSLSKTDIGVVFQDPCSSLDPRMKVEDLIGEPLAIHHLEKEKRIDSLLGLVHLSLSLKKRYPHELSGGQKQRVVVARALALSPKCLILDEPTSSLDMMTQMQIINLLKKLQTDLGLTYLFITHNLSLIPLIAHEVAILYKGHLIESGETESVLSHPQQPYTKLLCRDQNFSRELKKDLLLDVGHFLDLTHAK